MKPFLLISLLVLTTAVVTLTISCSPTPDLAPLALSNLPVYRGAESMTDPTQKDLADKMSQSLTDAVTDKNTENVASAAYVLGKDVGWDDINKFYQTSLGNEWESNSQMEKSQFGQTMKVWRRGKQYFYIFWFWDSSMQQPKESILALVLATNK